MSRPDTVVKRVLGALAFVGLLVALLGVGFDLVPGSSPGVSAPQLALVAGGVALLAGSLILRQPLARRAVVILLRQQFRTITIITVVTLFLLEFALVASGFPTYFPPDLPEKFLDPVPWWTCDQAGCHYEYDEMIAACERGELRDLRCIVNRQGFHDTQDFVVQPGFDQRLRVLVLGDSFTFGGSADPGKSFVEVVEQAFPDAVVWNTAIPGSGTNQALMSFNTYAPVLQPQVTLLGFYMNDFDDNMMPVDSYFMGVDSVNYQLSIRKYQIDLRGNLVKLDRQSDLYYRYHRVDPPLNELHRIVGITRLGSLGLRTVDAVLQMFSKAEGSRLSRRVEVTREYLAALQDAAAVKTQLLVLLIPSRQDIAAAGPLYQSARRLLDDLDIAYIDPVRRLDSEQDYATPPDVHWSNAGHQKIGSILVACLESFIAEARFADCSR